MSKELSIRQIAEKTSLSAHMLRYYERAGLMLPVGRAPSGHRRYTEEDLERMVFLLRLRSTGMPIAEMRRFADLMRQGDSKLADRYELLKAHERRLNAQLEEMEKTRAALADKLAMLSEKLVRYRASEAARHRESKPDTALE